MLKPLPTLVALLCAFVCTAQKTDTLFIFYKTDEYRIAALEKQYLDSFIHRGWDRVAIHGHTDETDEANYNIDLSGKRSAEVYRYLRRQISDSILSQQFFGEAQPIGDNATEEGRALNRRSEIIGYRYAKPVTIQLRPPVDPMLPLTQTLDNGMIITYRPGALPPYIADNLASGSSENFRVLTNTNEMRDYNLFNNTTNNEILSSVRILCGEQFNPCKLDTPVFIRLPINYSTNCALKKVKFFVATPAGNAQVWKEISKPVAVDTIGGMPYLGVWMDDFCNCINFDFKIDQECYDVDSTQLFYTQAEVRHLSAELKGMNSLYLPRLLQGNTHSLVYIRHQMNQAVLHFSLYDGKRRVRTFYYQPLRSLPYDSVAHQYTVRAGSCKFSFPDLNLFNIVLKVNRDKYRAYTLDQTDCAITYLQRPDERVTVDFTVIGKKDKLSTYTNLPLSSFFYNPATGQYVIDKNFIIQQQQKGAMAGH